MTCTRGSFSPEKRVYGFVALPVAHALLSFSNMTPKQLKFSDVALARFRISIDDENVHITTVETPDVSPNDVLKLVLNELPDHSFRAFSSSSGEGKQASVTFMSKTAEQATQLRAKAEEFRDL